MMMMMRCRTLLRPWRRPGAAWSTPVGPLRSRPWRFPRPFAGPEWAAPQRRRPGRRRLAARPAPAQSGHPRMSRAVAATVRARCPTQYLTGRRRQPARPRSPRTRRNRRSSMPPPSIRKSVRKSARCAAACAASARGFGPECPYRRSCFWGIAVSYGFGPEMDCQTRPTLCYNSRIVGV